MCLLELWICCPTVCWYGKTCGGPTEASQPRQTDEVGQRNTTHTLSHCSFFSLLFRLSERFQRQSHAGTGTCPPPSFSVSEQFFSSFLTTADRYIYNTTFIDTVVFIGESVCSYTFNWHITAALHQELLKVHNISLHHLTLPFSFLLQLHSRCQSVAVRDVPEVLQAMKLLAKFLGYIEFLPYTNSASTSLLHTRTASVSIHSVQLHSQYVVNVY